METILKCKVCSRWCDAEKHPVAITTFAGLRAALAACAKLITCTRCQADEANAELRMQKAETVPSLGRQQLPAGDRE